MKTCMTPRERVWAALNHREVDRIPIDLGGTPNSTICTLKEVGPYIDVIMIADDMGIQSGLLIKPDLYRKMVKPFHKRYVQLIKERTNAKVVVHACGSIVDLIEGYIEIGVDALHPMQVSAASMSPQNLKQRFGGRMAFWGGIDTQQLLPKGRPEDVR